MTEVSWVQILLWAIWFFLQKGELNWLSDKTCVCSCQTCNAKFKQIETNSPGRHRRLTTADHRRRWHCIAAGTFQDATTATATAIATATATTTTSYSLLAARNPQELIQPPFQPPFQPPTRLIVAQRYRQ